MTFSLRIQDVSRQAETFGAAIPVVRERDVYSGKLVLLNVPLGGGFRSALRIYDYDTADPRAVRVRIFPLEFATYPREPANALLDTVIPLLPPEVNPGAPRSPQFPAKAVIHDLANFSGVRDQMVRIEIEPVEPGLRFWAFASVTHDETQHVTLVLPD